MHVKSKLDKLAKVEKEKKKKFQEHEEELVKFTYFYYFIERSQGVQTLKVFHSFKTKRNYRRNLLKVALREGAAPKLKNLEHNREKETL